MTDKLEEEINLYDKIIVKNYNDLSLAEQFEKGAVVKVDDELTILKQQLAIAVEALEFYEHKKHIIETIKEFIKTPPSVYIGYTIYEWNDPVKHGCLSVEDGSIAKQAHQKIKELEK